MPHTYICFVYLFFLYDLCFLFFFSSRRRHTRYIGDWSSDVCLPICPRSVEGGNTRRGSVRQGTWNGASEDQVSMSAARIGRRTFFRRSFAAGALAAIRPSSPLSSTISFAQAPAIVTPAAARVALLQGVASGDVTAGRAVIWSRADRAARMFVEYSTTESFANPLRVPGPAALETSDFTARIVLTGLPD